MSLILYGSKVKIETAGQALVTSLCFMHYIVMPIIYYVAENSEYRISHLTSGRVTANTLTIQHFDDNKYSLHVYETILTTIDGTVQYQLRTQAIIARHSLCYNSQ
jgi:hypothetical protein